MMPVTYGRSSRTMSAARLSEGLLSATETIRLLSMIDGERKAVELSAIMRTLVSASPPRTANTLLLLSELNAVLVTDEKYHCAPRFADTPGAERSLRSAFLRYYGSLMDSANVGSTFQVRPETGELWADSLQLPFRDRGYPLLLLQLGLAARTSVNDRLWLLDAEAADYFMDLVGELNADYMKSGLFSLDKLKALKRSQEEAGKKGEEFALAFERRRLARHRHVSSVRSISEENASAGFDILSFDHANDLLHNRFVEVKSFDAEFSFYWSETERACAEALRNRYWLYLVDRSRISEQGYVPDMVRDPYSYFVEHLPDGWTKVETSLKFVGPPEARSLQ